MQNPKFLTGISSMKTGQCNYLISGSDLGQIMVTLILMATILLQNMQICSKDPNSWSWASGDNPFPSYTTPLHVSLVNGCNFEQTGHHDNHYFGHVSFVSLGEMLKIYFSLEMHQYELQYQRDININMSYRSTVAINH